MKLRHQAIAVGRTLLRTVGVEAKRYTPLAMACDVLARTASEPPVFVQIGANNGTDFDDFYEIATRNRLPGIVVEPVPRYFESLRRAYERYPEVRAVNAALHPTAASMTMYTIRPDAAKHVWQHGLASFDRKHVLNHMDVSDDDIAEQEVACLSFSALVDGYLPEGRIDILAIDTEGFDGEILKMVDFDRFRPFVIRFEQKHLARAEYAELRKRLEGYGYRLHETKQDCTAVLPLLTSRWRYLSTMLAA